MKGVRLAGFAIVSGSHRMVLGVVSCFSKKKVTRVMNKTRFSLSAEITPKNPLPCFPCLYMIPSNPLDRGVVSALGLQCVPNDIIT